jgi:hypothetical protein
LVVDRIKSIEESDESGSDDIYLILFRGRTAAPFKSGLNVVGPGSAWSDFDTGETHHNDVRVAGTSADSVYAVMVVEEDNARDISGDAVIGAWRGQTDLVWKSIMLGLVAAGVPTGSAAARAAAFAGISNALNGLASIYMEFPKGNDDVIEVKRVTITSAGQSETLRFRSDQEDATYDVTFEQTAAA